MSRRDIDFVKKSSMVKARRDNFSHPVDLVFKRNMSPEPEFLEDGDIPAKYKNIWYMKTMGSMEDALMELVGQELLRFMMPTHPKTRLVFSDDGENYYILSKQVHGFQGMHLLRDEITQGLLDGSMSGLGEVTAVTMWINDSDYKFGNLGVDAYGNVIKIDGNRCFSSLQEDVGHFNYNLADIDFNLLPYVPAGLADHWMDVLVNSAPRYQSSIPEMLQHKGMSREFNSGLLKILTMNDVLIRKFVHAYLGPDLPIAEKMIQMLIDRRNDLSKSAFRNGHFRRYLQSQEAEIDLEKHISNADKFTTTNKLPIEPEAARAETLQIMRERLAGLRENAQQYPDHLSVESLKKIAAELNNFISSTAPPKSIIGQRLSRIFDPTYDPGRIMNQREDAAELLKIIAAKDGPVSFDEVSRYVGAMTRQDEARHRAELEKLYFGDELLQGKQLTRENNSKLNEFHNKSKLVDCLKTIDSIMKTDREMQMKMTMPKPHGR